jgi:hypothetical protein
MFAAFRDLPFIHYDDFIAIANGGQPVGYYDTGYAPVLYGLYKLILGFGIQCGSSLVQNNNPRVLGQHPGDFYSLPLAA